jgi:hypothetical protein
VGVTCTSNVSASDNFNRADGDLGSSWTAFTGGGLAIASQTASGTSASGVTGDIRTGEQYGGDQYSQVQLAGPQLTGDQWIGPAIRLQSGGQNGYVGMYTWNQGSPSLKIYARAGTTWTQVGPSYATAALPAGTTLKLMATGNSLALLVNGVERIAAADATYVAGAPGIAASGTPEAGSWTGGTAGFEVHYLSTDVSGIETYDMINADDGNQPEPLRVLRPTNPAPGVPHHFLFVLPVEPGENATFGDGMQTMLSLGAANQYNLTIIEPSFAIDPWYADNPINPAEQQETFLTTQLVPWVKANLATTGTEQSWLIGFSKSGIGGQDLLLKHPGIFSLAASWDFPADAFAYDQFGSSSADSYGTSGNFASSYQLTPAFLAARKAPFVSSNRIWIGGYKAFQNDMADYDSLLTAEGIQHSSEAPTLMAHRWDSGWVPLALAALYADSQNLP